MDQQNWWEADPVVTQASPRMVPITPADPIEQGRYDLQLRKEGREAALAPLEARKTAADVARVENDNANADLSRRKLMADAAKAEAEAIKAARENGGQKNPDELAAVRAEAIDKIKLARSLQQRSRDGWFTTGFGSSIARQVGGTGAYDLAKDTDTLRNAGALTRIMEMAKQNGGKNPLTPLSNSDFEALANSLSNIDPSQSDEQYQANVQRIIDLYQRAYQGAGGTDLEGDIDPSKRRQPVAGTAGAAMPGAGQNGPTGGGPDRPNGTLMFNDEIAASKPGAFRYTPEQEAALTNIARQGGDPARLMEAARSFGAEISPESAKQVVEYYSRPEHRNETIGVDYGKTDALTPEQQAKADEIAKGTDGVGAAVMGAGDTLSVGLLDEAGAAVDAAFGEGTGSFSDRYNNALAINRNAQEQIRDKNTLPYVAGQIGGGILLPSRIGAAASTAGRTAIRAGMSRADAIRAAIGAGARRSGLEGGAFGAAYGFGSADGDLADRAVGGAVSGATGLLGGYVAGRAGGALAGRSRALGARERNLASLGDRQAFAQAAGRLDTPYMAADLPNAYGSQLATGLSNVTLGTLPLSRAAARNVEALGAARSQIAGEIGRVGDDAVAGQAIQRGIRSEALPSLESKTTELYEGIPISGKQEATLTNTRQALAEINQGLDSNSELSKLWVENPRMKATMQALMPATQEQLAARSASARDALDQAQEAFRAAAGPARDRARAAMIDARKSLTEAQAAEAAGPKERLTWEDMKRFRSIIGQAIGRPGLLSDGNQIARMRKLYAGLSEDMRATAQAQGPEALAKFERANTYARAVETRKREVFAQLLGDKDNLTPEETMAAVRSWSRLRGGDFSSLMQTFRSLPNRDADTVRATVLESMGRATSGAQDATGNLFSPARFMTDWNNLSDRAKSVLFQGDHKKAINDLVTVANGMKASTKYANTSKTGLAVSALGTVATGNPITALAAGLTQIGIGKLLSSRRVAVRLANMPKTATSATRYWNGPWVDKMARSEPAIASELLGLRDYMVRNLSSNAPRLAASPRMDAQNGVDDNR